MAPPTRQERQQMRQRGAGARKVDNLDFGITFGPRSASRPSSTPRTSHPSNAASRHRSKTPPRAGRKPSVARSARSNSAASETSVHQDSTSVRTRKHIKHSSELPVAKRRKTDVDADHLTTPGLLRSISETSRAVSGRRRVSRSAAIRIAEDEDVSAQETSNGVAVIVASDPQTSRSDAVDTSVDAEKENRDSEFQRVKLGQPSTEQKRRRKRKSISQQSLRKKKRTSTESSGSVDVVPSPTLAETVEGVEVQWRDVPDHRDAGWQAPAAPKALAKRCSGARRTKRKSVVLKPRKRRRSSDLVVQRHGAIAEPRTNEKSSSEQPRDIRRVRSILAASKGKPIQQTPSEAQAWETPAHLQLVEDGQDDDETYMEEEPSPEKPTPKVLAKRVKTKLRQGGGPVNGISTRQGGKSSRAIGGARKSKTTAKCSFPILTHRMANVFALPAISEEHEERTEDDGNHDVLAAFLEDKFSRRTTPNAIDVLAQFCRETIESAVTKLAKSNSEGQASVRRKRSATEVFGSTLDSRLFDMSAALEHRLTLEVRAKRARKEKSDLQAQWLEIRRQREEVALQCDEVRRRHEEMKEDGKAQLELSETLHELEMVVERETEEERERTLEFMLKDVAGRVSSANGGGLLDRVREFNKQLERTALVLGA